MHSIGLLSSPLPEVLESGLRHDSTSGQFVKRLITWIIHNFWYKNTFFNVYMSQEMTYNKPVAPLIQYKLIEKIVCKGWFKKLIIEFNQKG